jgi:hypothetical protein
MSLISCFSFVFQKKKKKPKMATDVLKKERMKDFNMLILLFAPSLK